MNIFDKYAKKINAEELAKSQEEINKNSNSGDYKGVPVGKYEVKVDKMECKLTKETKKPMVSIWFKVLAGDYKNSLIFYNGIFNEDFMRHRVVKLLSALLDDTTHEAEINLILKSGNVAEINDFCLDIHEAINGKFEYLLDYGIRKEFNTYAIEEVYDLT